MPASTPPDTPPNRPLRTAGTLDPAALTAEELARLLSAAGGRPVSPEQIRADIAAGAPAGPDGRIHLVSFAAWLMREMQAR